MGTALVRGGRAMATANKVTGGKRLALALGSIEQKITKGGVLRVGFLEGAMYPDAKGKGAPLPVAQVAFWNEFGTSRVPPRSFFRGAIRDKSKNWGAQLGAAVKHYNFDGAKALAVLGEIVKDDIVSSITAWPADNAESTVKAKGFNKGLIDKGIMQRAVDFELVK
jgi:hypothetical protein